MTPLRAPSSGEPAATPARFEDLLARLEQIVTEMEHAELPLEKLLSSYEEGMCLVKTCGDRLAEAEQKVEILTRSVEAAKPSILPAGEGAMPASTSETAAASATLLPNRRKTSGCSRNADFFHRSSLVRLRDSPAVKSSGEWLLWLGKRRKRMHALIVLFWVAIFLLPYLVTAWLPRSWDAVWTLRPCLVVDGAFTDLLERHGRTTPANSDIIFLGIDNASSQLDALDPAVVKSNRVLSLMTQGWPWSREIYAAALDRLEDAGARVVIFDILFLNSTEADPLLKASLDRHPDRVVVGCNFSDSYRVLSLPTPTLIPQHLPLDPRTAFVTFQPRIDGVIRGTTFHWTYNGSAIGQAESDVEVDSLATRAAAMARPDLAIPAGDAHHFIRYTGGTDAFDSASIYQIFDPDAWSRNFQNGQFFRGKIVMIGPRGNFRQDQHLTPFGPMDGAEVHLQALNALLHHEFLFYLGDSLLAMVLMVAAAGALAWVVGVTAHKGLWYGTAAMGCGAAYVGLGWPLYSAGIILPLTAPLGAFFSSTLTGLSAQYVLEQLERTRTRRFFERYVSPKVVREILDNPAGYYESLVRPAPRSHRPLQRSARLHLDDGEGQLRATGAGTQRVSPTHDPRALRPRRHPRQIHRRCGHGGLGQLHARSRSRLP